MKLSEAIRLGAMLRPQALGATRTVEGSCALGAALEAVGDATMYMAAASIWPWLRDFQRHPVAGYMMGISCIRSLNDSFGWTREQIADWVATVEPAIVEAPVAAEPVGQEVAA